MYKNILLAIVIAIITGCSAPKPEIAPSWYTNVPSDNELFYAIGTSDTVDKAKEKAVASMRSSLSAEINKLFTCQDSILQNLDNNLLKEISEHNKYISNKLALKNIKIVKSKEFKGNVLVLISTPRIEIFQKLKRISYVEYSRVKQEYKARQNPIAVKRFIVVDSLMKKYAKIASLTAYKDFLISTYNADDEFEFLNEMKGEHDRLKSTINIYVLTDANSRIFASTIKNAFKDKGLKTDNSALGPNSLKLLVTSDTEESKDYSFNKSKSLVKFTTFNFEKSKLSFRQHTFIGKSRKGYTDAKQQAAANLKYKIKKLGIFDFIGIEK